MKHTMKRLIAALLLVFLIGALCVPALAADAPAADDAAQAESAGSATGSKALAAAICVGLAAAAGAIGMGLAIAKSSEGIARQPEASDKIRTGLMLGLVFIETVVIYALIVAILVIFVL